MNIKETSTKKNRRISSQLSGDIDKLMKENMSLKVELALLKSKPSVDTKFANRELSTLQLRKELNNSRGYFFTFVV